MNKREMIEKVFKPLFIEAWIPVDKAITRLYKTLAEQAIVIECEVEHIRGKNYNFTYIGCDQPQGFHGTPGKALAIIVPLEEE